MNEEKREMSRDELLCNLNAIIAENEEIAKSLRETTIRADKAEYALKEAEGKIEWYKGQIEAYQYCMNCRR